MFAHLSLCLVIGIAAPNASAKPNVNPAAGFFPNAVSPQLGNSIGGHVFDRQRRPIERLYVELLNDLGQTISQTRTDSSGRYEFRGVSHGVFQIRVRTYGTSFISQTERIEIINFGRNVSGGMSGSQYMPVDFTLRTEDRESPRGAPGTVFAQPVPDGARRVYEQAVGELDRGRSDEGLAGLRRAIELFPDYFLALDRLGAEYVRREYYEPARIILMQAVRINSRSQQSLYWLGIAQHHLRQPTEAIESLTRALALAPDSVNTNMWLGIVYRVNGNSALAETHLKRAKELGNNRVPDAHWQLALLYNTLRRYREAADELELFLRAQPDARDAERIRRLIAQLRARAE